MLMLIAHRSLCNTTTMMELHTSPVAATATNEAICTMQPEAQPAPPPVLRPLHPPEPTEATNCHCLSGSSNDKDESNNDMKGVSAGELDNSAATLLFVERVKHLLRGKNILEANQAVVEFTVLTEYGSYISNM